MSATSGFTHKLTTLPDFITVVTLGSTTANPLPGSTTLPTTLPTTGPTTKPTRIISISSSTGISTTLPLLPEEILANTVQPDPVTGQVPGQVQGLSPLIGLSALAAIFPIIIIIVVCTKKRRRTTTDSEAAKTTEDEGDATSVYETYLTATPDNTFTGNIADDPEDQKETVKRDNDCYYTTQKETSHSAVNNIYQNTPKEQGFPITRDPLESLTV